MDRKLERIVCVDDEPDIRTIAQCVLEGIGGYTVEYCSNGLEAIERVASFKPQLIILDVMMPGLDGIETLKRLKAMDEMSGVPVIFMTAKAMHREREFYRTLGIADVISKPFDPMELCERVETVWHQRSELQESA